MPSNVHQMDARVEDAAVMDDAVGVARQPIGNVHER
jgi:hypothetical protein